MRELGTMGDPGDSRTATADRCTATDGSCARPHCFDCNTYHVWAAGDVCRLCVPKTVRMRGVWLRRVGDVVQVLVRIGNEWRIVIQEPYDYHHDCSVYAIDAPSWPVDGLTALSPVVGEAHNSQADPLVDERKP